MWYGTKKCYRRNGKKNGLKITYYETSALNGQGIKEAFEALTRDIMKKRGVGEGNNDGGGVALNKEKKKKSKKEGDCC